MAAGPLRDVVGFLSYFYKTIDVNDITNLRKVWQNLEPQLNDGRLGRKHQVGKIGEMYPDMNMIDLPLDKEYNLIYANWGFGYVNKPDVLLLLAKARRSLSTKKRTPGTIIMKETIKDPGDPREFVEGQNLYLRTVEEYKALFDRAGYKLMRTSKPQVFDKDSYMSQMFAI